MSTPFDLDESWRAYERRVLPVDAPKVQRIECRRAFYAGAYAVFYGLLSSMSSEDDATPADLSVMERMQAALDRFEKSIDAEVAALDPNRGKS